MINELLGFLWSPLKANKWDVTVKVWCIAIRRHSSEVGPGSNILMTKIGIWRVEKLGGGGKRETGDLKSLMVEGVRETDGHSQKHDI